MKRNWRTYLITGWRFLRRAAGIVVIVAVFGLTVPGMRPNANDESFQVLGLAREHLFDFVNWELNTLTDKAISEAVGAYRFMSPDERADYVRDYLQLVADTQRLETKVQNIYVDPAIDDPLSASADVRAERDRLRAEQQSRQALAEAIIQAQTAHLLADYGFDVPVYVVFPPVMIRFTQLPTILIVSPRDRIDRIASYGLEHGMTVDERELVETRVDDQLDVSSLIVPIGGLAVWPAMLIETSNTSSVMDVTAHEWSHHYLALFPLGFNYGETRELITINETVASIIGTEIGWAVMDRFYPDLAPPPPDYTPQPPPEPGPPSEPDPEPDAFDFRAEMRETRIKVDGLLASGLVEEAELYMEDRRQLFVGEGYNIRKLNQAYFAFYGSYADEPGATGADPIGPTLRELRYYSDSLSEFVYRVRDETTLAGIQQELEAAKLAASVETGR